MRSAFRKSTFLLTFSALPLLVLLGCTAPTPPTPPTPAKVLWTEQFGTSAFDDVRAVATDPEDNVLVVGRTAGNLAVGGAGAYDAHVRKFAPGGTLVWSRQFGTPDHDGAYVVATDSGGNVIVGGYTYGDLEGASAGGADAFVRKYSSAGAIVWTRQFGTPWDEDVRGVATDSSGNVYVAGSTGGVLVGTFGGFDVFVRKYTADGNLDWTLQFGTSDDDGARGITVDSAGYVVVAGFTKGNMDGPSAGESDVFVRKLTPAGVELWTHQFGTSSTDSSRGVATDSADNIVVVGYTAGDVEGASAGDDDAFARKLDPNGVPLWTRQFGTGFEDRPGGVAIDSQDNVIVAGYTDGDLKGATAGEYDVFVRRFTPTGAVDWTEQFGTEESDRARGVAVDSQRNIVLAGETAGNLDGVASGDVDAFVRVYAP